MVAHTNTRMSSWLTPAGTVKLPVPQLPDGRPNRHIVLSLAPGPSHGTAGPSQDSEVLSVQLPPPRSGVVRFAQQSFQKQLPYRRPMLIQPARVPSSAVAETFTRTSTPEPSSSVLQLNAFPDSTATPSSCTALLGRVKFSTMSALAAAPPAVPASVYGFPGINATLVSEPTVAFRSSASSEIGFDTSTSSCECQRTSRISVN